MNLQTTALLISIVFTVLNFIALVWILPMRKHLLKLRENELLHVSDALERIENKLDAHIKWHLEDR